MKNTLLIFLFLITMILQGFSQTLTITPSNANICYGETIAFNYVQTGLVAPISCVWDFGDGSTSMVCNPTHSYFFGTSYDVCLTLTDANNFQIQECVTIVEEEDILFTLQGGDVSCGGSNDGYIDCIPSNGGVYTYTWSNGATTQQITNLQVGTYMVTVTNMIGCTQAEAYIISEPSQIITSLFTTDPSGCGASDGDISAMNTTGGTPPYTYTWSNGMTPAVVTGLPVGTYEVTITDSNGCTVAESAILSEPSTTSVFFTINNLPVATTCAGTADGFVDFTYAPTTGITVDIISAAANPLPVVNGSLPGGQYCLVATDANGCFAGQECFDVIQPFPLNATGTSDEFICPGESANLMINEAFSSYLWSTGETTQSINVTVGGTYACTITDFDGCTAEYSFPDVVEQTNCVWPGDANYDGVADNLDILALGLAYGNTGLSRDNQDINWEGHFAPFDWDSIYINGINRKHADSDGSGLVDMDDTMAVVQNYGLAPHALRETSSAGGSYPMAINFDVGTSNYGEAINMEVNIGDVTQSIPDGYGIAFSIQFNYPEVINPSTVSVDFSNSVFGSSNETITLYKDLLDQGRMDFAITRFDHNSMGNLMGEVLRLNFIIEDNIDGFSSTDYTLEANIVDVMCIKTWGDEVTLIPDTDQLLMLGTNANNTPIVGEGIEAYPNPTNDIIHLNINDGTAIQKVRVFNTIGELIADRRSSNIISMNTSDWVEGIYFFEIIDENEQAYLIKVCKK